MKRLYALIILLSILQTPLSVAMESYEVGQKIIESSVQLMGQWMPMTVTPVRAPVCARIKTVHYAYGQSIEKGAVLFELENKDLDFEIEQAHLDYIKQQQICHKLENWSSSEELLQAQRDLELAKSDYDAKKEHLMHTKKLVALGGIAKETLAQEEVYVERSQQHVSLATSRYEQIKSKGDHYAKVSAQLALAKQKQTLDTLSHQASGLIQRAQQSGVLYAPHLFNPNEKRPIQVDEVVQAKQWLGVIASPEDYGIMLTLDDSWMDKLEQAQKIKVQIIDEEIWAHVESIEPIQMMTQSQQKPQYQVALKLDKKPEKLLRLGHKVSVKLIHQYPVSTAIPLKAIAWQADGAYVQSYHTKKQGYTPKKVILGHMGEDWAEVVEGLERGEIIGFKA